MNENEHLEALKTETPLMVKFLLRSLLASTHAKKEKYLNMLLSSAYLRGQVDALNFKEKYETLDKHRESNPL